MKICENQGIQQGKELHGMKMDDFCIQIWLFEGQNMAK